MAYADNAITSAVGSELYSNIVQEAIFTAQERSVMLPLITVYDISGVAGKTAQIPIYPTVAAAGLTEGTDMDDTAINPTSVTITAQEYGVMALLTDLMRDSAGRNVAADLGRILGEAVAKKQDDTVIALFDGFSTSLGSTSTQLTVDALFEAQALLREQNAPTGADGLYYGVFNPRQVYNLKKTIASNGSGVVPALSDIGNQALRAGYVGTIAGIAIFEHAGVSVSGGSGKGAVFSPEALGAAVKRGFSLEPERNASLRATELNATAVWGVAELVDAYGVEMLFQSGF